MKKTLTILSFIILALVTTSSALAVATVDLDRTINVTAETGVSLSVIRNTHITPNNEVIVTGSSGTTGYVFVFRQSDGSLIYSQSFTLTTVFSDYKDEYLLLCQPGGTTAIQVLDMRTFGFYSLSGADTPSISVGQCFIDVIENDRVKFLADHNGGTNGLYAWFDTQSDTLTHEVIIGAGTHDLDNFVAFDTDNNVYAAGNDLWEYEGENHSIIYTASADFDLFNLDSDDPKYLLTDGKKVITTGSPDPYDSLAETGSQYDTNNDGHYYTADQAIYASNNGLWQIVDFSDNIVPTNSSTSEPFLGSSVAPRRFQGTNFLTYASATNLFHIWSYDSGTPTVAGNNLPLVSGDFLGVTDNLDDFVFKVSGQDADGGQLFYAIDIREVGGFGNNTFSQTIDFNDPADLTNFITPNTFFDNYSLSFSTPFTEFNLDGSLLHNISSNLIYVDIDLPDAGSADADGDVTVQTSFYNDFDSGDAISSYNLYAPDGTFISSLEFRVDATETEINVSHWDGATLTFLDNETWFATNFLVVTADIDFSAKTIDYLVQDRLGTTIAQNTVSFITNADAVGTARFNEFTTPQAFYLDYISVSYQTGALGFPTYKSLGISQPDVVLRRSALETSQPFGDYEARVYITDPTLGLTHYDIFDTLLFTYDENTKTLSAAEIDDLVDGEGLFEEGDLITDLLPNFLDSVGLKTSFSRMFAGFILLLLVFGFLSGYPVEAQILGVTIGFTLLSIFGFFPTWLLVVVIVIAIALFARAMRSTFAGGN